MDKKTFIAGFLLSSALYGDNGAVDMNAGGSTRSVSVTVHNSFQKAGQPNKVKNWVKGIFNQKRTPQEQEEEIRQQRRQRQFAEDFMGLEEGDNPEIQLQWDEQAPLGQGTFGTVYGTQDGEYIVKRPNNRQGKRDMRKEKANSEAIEESLYRKLREENPGYGRLQGLNFITTVKGLGKDGSLVQKKVRGKDASKTIYGEPPFNLPSHPYSPWGVPENLQEAILRAATFISGLVALHEAGYVHCDLKLGNIMIEDNPALGYPCKIIDLGAAKKIGKQITATSGNAAPEINKGDITATTAFDVYAAGTMLPGLLFGTASGNDFYYFRNRSGLKKYEEDIGKFYENFSIDSEMFEDWVRKNFIDYNEKMLNWAGYSYPGGVIIRLARLVARMLAKNPSERPSAIEVQEELTDMGLADWDHGFYSVQ